MAADAPRVATRFPSAGLRNERFLGDSAAECEWFGCSGWS